MTLRSASSSTATGVSDGVVRASGVIVESIYLGTGHRLHVRLDDGTQLVVLEQSTGCGGRRRSSAASTWWRAGRVDDLVTVT